MKKAIALFALGSILSASADPFTLIAQKPGGPFFGNSFLGYGISNDSTVVGTDGYVEFFVGHSFPVQWTPTAGMSLIPVDGSSVPGWIASNPVSITADAKSILVQLSTGGGLTSIQGSAIVDIHGTTLISMGSIGTHTTRLNWLSDHGKTALGSVTDGLFEMGGEMLLWNQNGLQTIGPANSNPTALSGDGKHIAGSTPSGPIIGDTSSLLFSPVLAPGDFVRGIGNDGTSLAYTHAGQAWLRRNGTDLNLTHDTASEWSVADTSSDLSHVLLNRLADHSVWLWTETSGLVNIFDKLRSEGNHEADGLTTVGIQLSPDGHWILGQSSLSEPSPYSWTFDTSGIAPLNSVPEASSVLGYVILICSFWRPRHRNPSKVKSLPRNFCCH